MLRNDERTALFIDGPNHYAAARFIKLDIDYRKLLDYSFNQCRPIRANYYTALHSDQESSTFRSLTNRIDYNGYNVITQRPREYFTAGKRKVKK